MIQCTLSMQGGAGALKSVLSLPRQKRVVFAATIGYRMDGIDVVSRERVGKNIKFNGVVSMGHPKIRSSAPTPSIRLTRRYFV